ncbi:hypothetical protein AYK61_07695 [Rhodococcus sp. SBT000017]|uniref:hypothetical protein n=1 Tax=Rhodococcus sp. SBT000017 TaxID=1803385 RepID=UPI000EF94564|nr:hypothetical protein [Rhodococcus sp. SBT000017]RMB76430.1 hypothetical protein AYK61_07695 [Rhodococcus sp. SBT000017]
MIAGSRAVETVTVTATGGRIEAESVLSSRHGDVDSSVSQKNYLSDLIDLSTLTTSSNSAAGGTPTNPGNVWNAMQGCGAALP